MTVNPIETMYAGHRFRSRLEARWAVVFDALGIAWRYEPEGFEHHGFRYLPDFHLPGEQMWVEVKGDPAWPASEAGKELLFRLDCGGLLPFFHGCADPQPDGAQCGGLLLLGDIPTGNGLHTHQLLCHHKGLVRRWAMFGPRGSLFDFRTAGIFERLLGLEDVCGLDYSWVIESRYIPEFAASKGVRAAYDAGRMARFEHGENPAAVRLPSRFALPLPVPYRGGHADDIEHDRHEG